MSDLLVAVHVPRTGGVTLRQALVAACGADRVVCAHEERLEGWRAGGELERRLSDPVAVIGHFRHGVHRWLDRRCRYVTLLRDPVERIVSHWRWACRHPESPLHDDAVSLGLAGYVESARSHELFNNGQVRLLGELIGRPPRPADRTTLRRALRHLDDYALVGLTGRWAQTAARAARELGLEGIPEGLHANAAPADDPPPEIDEVTRRTIAQHNALDVELLAAVADHPSFAAPVR